MGGTVHCEPSSAQWFVLSYRCTGTKERWAGQTRVRGQATMEYSSTPTFLLMKGAMYVPRLILNEMSALRGWSSGTASLLCLCFISVCQFRSYAELFWTSSQTSSNVWCVTNLVTRLTNAKMVVKSKDEKRGKHENGLGDSVQKYSSACVVY